LIHLKEFDIELEIIFGFDHWLGQLKGLKRKGIRPARFAVDMGFDFNLCNEVFSLSALKLNIFQINYEIYSPYQNHEMVRSVNKLDDIPTCLRCPETGGNFNPFDFDEYIEITFDLIVTPDPDKPKKNINISTNTYNSIRSIKSKLGSTLNAKAFFPTSLGREEIDNSIFKPDWNAYDQAYKRFVDSFLAGVSPDEKGKALEGLSCLSLSFITFFRVDKTVHTNTNQIDVTVTVRPYFKYIEIPLLRVIQRRILCECKNEAENVPSLWVDKLAAGIDKVDNCKLGIIFSRNDFSGDDLKYARASQIEHARLKKYVISITKNDFENIKNNRLNILYFLDDKVEELEMRITKREL
jgi:hypothetical protein